MQTPEGRVKAALKGALKGLAIDHSRMYVHWPVLNGMGSAEIDCNILYKGQAYAIECKAPGKRPTDRQWDTLNAKRRAGAWCFVLGGVWGEYRGRPMAEADTEDLNLILRFLTCNIPRNNQSGEELMHGNWKKYGASMADWTDHADEIINVLQGAAVTNARYAAIPHPPEEFDGRHCIDCDEPIPAVRLNHGLYLCIDCATFAERKAKVNR